MTNRFFNILLFTIFFAIPMFGQSTATEKQTDSPNCPKIEIVGPPTVKQPGETMEFRIEVEETDRKLSYLWSVDKGLIVSGQGKPEIVVAETEELGYQTITATLNIEGLEPTCKNTYSDTGVVAGNSLCIPLDEFGSLASDDLKARIDNLFISIQSDQKSTGYIVTYGPPGEVTKRHRIIREHIEFRSYDISRLNLDYRNYAEQIRSVVWVVPQAASTDCIK